MNRDVCEHSTPVDLPCDKCRVANRGGHIAVAMSRIADLEAQRDALLKALKDATKTIEHSAILLQRLSEPAPPSRRQKERSDDQR